MTEIRHLKHIIAESVSHFVTDKRFKENPSFETLEQIIKDNNLDISQIFAHATLLVNKGKANRKIRNTIKYILFNRPKEELCYTVNSIDKWSIDAKTIMECMISTNEIIELIYDLTLLYDVNIFETLGMRNLSSFVGELFGHEVYRVYSDKLIKNPNQDGYPDLCALTTEGKRYIQDHLQPNGKPQPNKEFWSSYPFGGIEVKATCGNTPPASVCPKPLLGESRLSIMLNAEWKAHHQETKILCGILWDFIDQIPTVLSTFFRNDLDTTIGVANADWAKTITPREGGGRTTSVSIMRRGKNKDQGVRKMGQGWLVLPENKNLLKPICKIFDIIID